jgi:hypothetical protein
MTRWAVKGEEKEGPSHDPFERIIPRSKMRTLTTKNASVLNFLFTVKFVKLVNLVNRQPIPVGHTLTESGNSYDITHGQYSVTWPLDCLYSWPQFTLIAMLYVF